MSLHSTNIRSPFILCLALLLTGCGGTKLVVTGDFPDPLVDPIPLKMGTYFPEEFSNYEFVQERDKRGGAAISIDSGRSQVKLFQRVFGSYFQTVRALDGLPEDQVLDGLDGIIVPEVAQLQVSVPSETKTKVYEVWIKYNMNLYQPDGVKVLTWPVTAYGKTPKRFMKTREIALQQAFVVALRDAGAHFVSRFDRLPLVKEWLAARGNNPTEPGEG